MYQFEKDQLVKRVAERIAKAPTKSSAELKRIVRDVVNRSNITKVPTEKEGIIRELSTELSAHSAAARASRATKVRESVARDKRVSP